MLANICYTASVGRMHFPVRIVILAKDISTMIKQILIWLDSPVAGTIIGEDRSGISNAYISGNSVDWDAYFSKFSCSQMSLPTYPFQRQSCWVEKDYSNLNQYNGKLNVHPLLGEQIHSSVAYMQFQNVIDLNDSQLKFLDDHRLSNKPIFPGTGFIDILLIASRFALKKNKFVLREININKPLFLSKEKNISLSTLLSLQSNFFIIKISSSVDEVKHKNSEWLEHVSAQVSLTEDFFIPELSKINNGLKDNSFNKISAENFRSLFENTDTQGLYYGPYFQNIKDIYVNSTGIIKGVIESVPN